MAQLVRNKERTWNPPWASRFIQRCVRLCCNNGGQSSARVSCGTEEVCVAVDAVRWPLLEAEEGELIEGEAPQLIHFQRSIGGIKVQDLLRDQQAITFATGHVSFFS